MYIIAVVGGSSVKKNVYETARKAGEEIAGKKAVLLCGGLSGVMEAACRGAKSKGGVTIGILPGKNKSAANKYVDYAVATGMGEARNAVIINTADGVVAIDGKEGTLSEIAFALKQKKPIAGVETYDIEGMIKKENPGEAVRQVIKTLREKGG